MEVYDEKAFELNKALLNAVTACDYEEAERLLVAGADPLGSTDETDADEHLLGELFVKCRITRIWKLRSRSFWSFLCARNGYCLPQHPYG